MRSVGVSLLLVISLAIQATPALADPTLPTTVAFTLAPTSVLPGQSVGYSAVFSPAAATGTPVFEQSTDGGATWTGLVAPILFNDGQFGGSTEAPVTEGTRLIRARFVATGDYLSSTSETVVQVIAKQPSAVIIMQLLDGSYSEEARPGSATVTLRASGSGSTMTKGRGNVLFEQLIADAWVERGTALPQAGGPVQGPGFSANLAIANPGVGQHTFRATYLGDAQYTVSPAFSAVLEIARMQPSLDIDAPLQVQANHDFLLDITLGKTESTNYPVTGGITLKEGDNALGSDPSRITMTLPARPVGVYNFSVDYPGDVNFAPASQAFQVTVVPDTVEATVKGLSPTTFYPFVDGYRDTVTASGTRTETASASLSVKNSTGKIVRTGSVAAGIGAYTWAWNGKTTAGALVPAGTYRITTTLKDTAGTTSVKPAQSVVVSPKRLSWSTTKTIDKSASQAIKKTSSWGAWQFTMPAGVAYRSLKLTAYGKTIVLTYVPPGFGAQDVRTCAWTVISPNCVEHEFRFPGLSGGSKAGALSATNERHGRDVRAYVWAGSSGSRASVTKLRLTFQYAVLK